MSPIDPEAWRERMARIEELFGQLVQHAEVVSRSRCPYKNRFNECTAKFGCRNQRRANVKGGPLRCGGDDKLDFRSAWESGAAQPVDAPPIKPMA